MPSLIIITLAAAVLQVIIRNVWVQHALMGIRAVVCALMLNTVLTMGKKVIKGRFAAFLTRTPTVVIVLSCAFVGIVWLVFLNRGPQS